MSESPHSTSTAPRKETPVADGSLPAPDPSPTPDDTVTVTLTCTGDQAEVLHTLARLEGRTPEEVALDHIARGVPLAFSSALGEDSQAMATLARAMFDGPTDLAARSGEGLFGETGSR
jgi:hypothetical protein